jgi:hypothetical protein
MNFEAWQWALAVVGALAIGLAKTGIGGLGMLAVVIFANLMPAKAARSPISSGAWPVVTICLNSLKSDSASAGVLPLTWVVMSEVAACEMAQPEPSKPMASTRPSSARWRKTVQLSPQLGLSPVATRLAVGGLPRLRGRLLWSRMTV